MKGCISDDALTALVKTGGGHLYTLCSKREPIWVFRSPESLSRYCDGISQRKLRLEP